MWRPYPFALQDGHFNLTPSEAQQLMAQIDIDHSGDICFDQWIASLVDWRKVGGKGGAFRQGMFGGGLECSSPAVVVCGAEWRPTWGNHI